MTQQAHILISGRDPVLLAVRGFVLRSAGYRVSTTLRPVEGSSELGSVQLFLVCHTLSDTERANDLAMLADISPQAKALCLVPFPGSTEVGVPTLDSFLGPREMVRAVNQLLPIEPLPEILC